MARERDEEAWAVEGLEGGGGEGGNEARGDVEEVDECAGRGAGFWVAERW